jgi:lipopolysaccharide/colanic/teichoic acid biosynthesis glycosyltransferase
MKNYIGEVGKICRGPVNYVIGKLDDVFYWHEVIGHRGRSFYALKLRTMRREANGELEERMNENGLNHYGKPDDNIYVKNGFFAWLRGHFLDEVFQIVWNILIQGNMRWAGERPRPWKMWLKELSEGIVTIEEVCKRLEKLPGLFGAQYRYPHLNAEEARKAWYIEEERRPGSLALDHVIRTSWGILTGRIKSE